MSFGLRVLDVEFWVEGFRYRVWGWRRSDHLWVEVAVVDDDGVGAREVEPLPSRACRQQKTKNLRVLPVAGGMTGLSLRIWGLGL